MLTKSTYMRDHPGLTDGMKVSGSDGENLGKIQYLDEDSFVVEKGFFFPKDFAFRYDDILDLKDNEVVVRQTKADLSDWQSSEYVGWSQTEDVNAGRIPVVKEEVKIEREPGLTRGELTEEERKKAI